MFPRNLIVENLLRRGELLCYDYLKEQKTLNSFSHESEGCCIYRACHGVLMKIKELMIIFANFSHRLK